MWQIERQQSKFELNSLQILNCVYFKPELNVACCCCLCVASFAFRVRTYVFTNRKQEVNKLDRFGGVSPTVFWSSRPKLHFTYKELVRNLPSSPLAWLGATCACAKFTLAQGWGLVAFKRYVWPQIKVHGAAKSDLVSNSSMAQQRIRRNKIYLMYENSALQYKSNITTASKANVSVIFTAFDLLRSIARQNRSHLYDRCASWRIEHTITHTCAYANVNTTSMEARALPKRMRCGAGKRNGSFTEIELWQNAAIYLAGVIKGIFTSFM